MSTQEQNFGEHLEAAVRTIAQTRGDGAENQDNYCLIDGLGTAKFMLDHQDHFVSIDDWPNGHIRLAIMDGMGGHESGREVAEATAKQLSQIPACYTVDTLSEALNSLHEQLRVDFSGASKTPGCTLTLVEIPVNKPALLFHVGDSRLYHIDESSVEYLTIDHVPATRLLMNDQISTEEWHQRVHLETRFEISQAFILGNNINKSHELDSSLLALSTDNLPEFLHPLEDRRVIPLSNSGLYLLGSDGLWCQNDPQTFINGWPTLLNKPERSIQALVDDLLVDLIVKSDDDQHQDNATAIIFRCK